MKERLKSLFGAEPVRWPDIAWVTTEPLTGVAPDGEEGVLDTCTEGDLAFLQYTSGSTAEPKVRPLRVCLPHPRAAVRMLLPVWTCGVTAACGTGVQATLSAARVRTHCLTLRALLPHRA